MTASQPVAATWSSEALFAKAQRYAEEMLSHSHSDWQCSFWSSLVLEMLARAALAHVSPVLLADGLNWQHVYSALGHTPTASKYTPKSITITEVLARLRDIDSNFVTELERFCIAHTGSRNAELHSGDTPFEGIKSSSWRPMFYRACDVLAKSMGRDLDQLVGSEEAGVAATLIAAALDAAAKAVLGEIQAYKTVWSNKATKDKEKLARQAEQWATKQAGHRVSCPACGCDALVMGEPIGSPKTTIEDDQITETQQYLPNKFECVACGLKISGLSQLNASGLGDTYKKTITYDAAEHYAQDPDYADYEDDNNEP